MKTIKIAPYAEEISVSGNEMRTDFAGGIAYKAEGLEQYKEEYLKECFRAAIAISGKRWILEEIMNSHLHLNGTIL